MLYNYLPMKDRILQLFEDLEKLNSNTMHVMQLRDEYFDKINKGEKIYEIRLSDEKRKKIRIGDDILFLKYSDFHKRIKVRVLHIYNHKSIEEVLNVYSLDALGFKGMSKPEVLDIITQIYPKTEIKKHGLVLIHIVKISN